MSIRLGRSRTCFRREKLVRARGATIVLLKMRQPPLTACRVGGARKLGAEPRRIADAHAPPQPPLVAASAETSSVSVAGDGACEDGLVGQREASQARGLPLPEHRSPPP